MPIFSEKCSELCVENQWHTLLDYSVYKVDGSHISFWQCIRPKRKRKEETILTFHSKFSTGLQKAVHFSWDTATASKVNVVFRVTAQWTDNGWWCSGSLWNTLLCRYRLFHTHTHKHTHTHTHTHEHTHTGMRVNAWLNSCLVMAVASGLFLNSLIIFIPKCRLSVLGILKSCQSHWII